ncbi:hypothetical protein [Plastoroseomonas arctica]|uniref:Fungal lipase-like domain-containing protein n=1 Tax=Plastoroseomonas arctica TaxID=1509237 RepID=A0AAF1KHD5_9PROT|nr:hypothetical protein [Plastoroseomonas arctica]MBR0653834.1 hypothetical protein [Plastoroseomonas arctica]
MPITYLEYAAIAAAAYYPTRADTGRGFARFSPMRREMSGFQGAIYRRAGGGTNAWVVGIAGTQPTDGGGADVVADAGFGGAAGAVFGIPGAILSLAGAVLLSRQCASAEQLVTEARAAMARGDSLSITGHSLGGGIAQIVAARTGVTAMAFNPPAVTAVGGVAAAYGRTKPKITNLKVKNDPINYSGAVGGWLGKVVILNSPRSGGDAHSIDRTIAELSPAGAFSALGGSDPFA